MKKLKILLLACGLLLTLFIILFGAWLWHLDARVTRGLEQRSFSPPTEFWTAPQWVAPQESPLRESLIEELKQEGFEATPQACPRENSASTCYRAELRNPTDPFFKGLSQLLIFDDQDRLSTGFYRPGQVFAQYVGDKPILQNYKRLGEFPPACRNAVLAIEDPRFLDHTGVSLRAIVRALLNNLRGGAQQGGSTITQQMVKNFFLTPERTLERKLTEFFMSLLLELHSSKDLIFETYLNIIYLGQSGPFEVRGFGAAAKYYFQKDLELLDTSECALIAAVLNSPGLYSPFSKPENSLKRRNLVLKKMTEYQFLTEEELKASLAQPLPENKNPRVASTAPFYVQTVLSELKQKGIVSDGAHIFTGLDLEQQAAAQKAVQSQLQRLEETAKTIKARKEKGQALEAVFLSAEHQHGWIQAAAGGRSFRQSQFNRITEAKRQVGSVFKPFVFLTALEKNSDLTPLSLFYDERKTFRWNQKEWSPENYGKKYFGEVPFYFVASQSLNSITAEMALDVGLKAVIETARVSGVTSELQEFPALSLGAFEMTPLEVLQSYGSFTQTITHHSFSTVRAVSDVEGNLLYTKENPTQPPHDTVAQANLVSMLKLTNQIGTAKSVAQAGFVFESAGKTGTTSDNKDAWYVGFTPNRTSLVWIGYDQPLPTDLTGGSGALPIWIEFVKSTSDREKFMDFIWPKTVEKEVVTDVLKTDGSKVEVEIFRFR
jgi:penicillin-binding protein 1B